MSEFSKSVRRLAQPALKSQTTHRLLYIKRETDILQLMRRFIESISIVNVNHLAGKPVNRNTNFLLWVGVGLTLAAAVPATANASGDPAAPAATNNATGFSPGPNSVPLPDKSQYNLFHATPEALMRDLSADRPDKTDCPQTVDAGHFQIEMDFANLTYDPPNSQRGNVTSTTFQAAPVSLKAGILNNADLELVFTPYEWERTDNHTTGMVERTAGFDGLTPRLKVNLVGNEGGPFALALVPFVNFPVVSGSLAEGAFAGGLAIPYSFAIAGWSVGFENTFHVNPNATGAGYHAEFANSVAVGHGLIGGLSLSLEFFANVNTERNSDWAGTVDTWLTYQVNKAFSLDGGVYIGVTRGADDWHPWVGVTRRF